MADIRHIKASTIIGPFSITIDQAGNVEFRTFNQTDRNTLIAQEAAELLLWLSEQGGTIMGLDERWSSSYEEVNARRMQGQRVLVERTAESHLSSNLTIHFGIDRSLEMIRWLQGLRARPAFDVEECKAWLLSDECTQDVGQGIDFSAYADEQEQCIQDARDRYRELVERL